MSVEPKQGFCDQLTSGRQPSTSLAIAAAGLSEDGQRKMAAFVANTAGLKDVAPVEKVFDSSFIRKADAALLAKGWKPGS